MMNHHWKLGSGILAAVIVVTGIVTATAFVLNRGQGHGETRESQAAVKMYVCSMEPQIIRDKPGTCPICGMDLIEKKEFDQNYADFKLNDVVKPVNETVLSSVQTICPFEEELPLMIDVSGIINFDVRNIRTISARYGGLIEHSYIKYTYQPIQKGQKIFDIYAPEIYATHMNYINLIKKYPGHDDISKDARDWLEMLGLTEEQIDQLCKEDKLNYHLSVYSDAEGFVVDADFDPETALVFDDDKDLPGGAVGSGSRGLGLNEGVIIEAGEPLFKVITTESVRADLKVRNEDAGLLRTGQKVVLTDAVSPGRKMNATVTQIEPLNGSLFQLVKVFITDREKSLVPGMKIQAHIEAGKRKSLWVSKSAIAYLGRQQAVFLLQDSIFVATAVKTGLRSGDQVEICSGIDKDSRVALNASLLTDSDGFIKTSSK